MPAILPDAELGQTANGFDGEEAALRSSVLFATGVGLLHEAPVTTHEPPAPLRGNVLDLMLRR